MILSSQEKENFFKSGVPLEIATCQLFAKYKSFVTPQISYLRGGKEFSIDCNAHYINNSLKNKIYTSVWLDFLIECKFTNETKNNKWVFFAYGPRIKQISRDEVIIAPFGEIEKTHKRFNSETLKIFNDTKIKKFLAKTRVVQKGITIGKQISTESHIKEAVSQIQFAYIHSLMKIIDFNFPERFLKNREYLIMPIIVTNHDLYISKSSFNLNDIAKKTPFKIYKQKWLILDAGYSSELIEYNKENFSKKYKEILEEKREWERGWEENLNKEKDSDLKEFDKKFSEKINHFENNYLKKLSRKIFEPQYVWIVNSSYLENFLKELYRSLGADNVNQ